MIRALALLFIATPPTNSAAEPVLQSAAPLEAGSPRAPLGSHPRNGLDVGGTLGASRSLSRARMRRGSTMTHPAILVAWAQTSTGTEVLIARLVRGQEDLPALTDVQTWATNALGLPSRDDATGWATRARLRGLVPRVAGRIGSDANVYVRDSLGDWAPTTTDRRALAMRIEARFDLGDLVFADLELRANREAIARAAAERLVLEEVTRLYFERVELYLASLCHPTAQASLRAAEVDGLLTGYTGGRFRARADRSSHHED